MSQEENKNINYLDFSIYRNTNNMDLNVYRKPTYIDITKHLSSNHPYEHKLAAFIHYIKRMITLPITEQNKNQEWNKILTTANNNGFPEYTIRKLKSKLIAKRERSLSTQATRQNSQKWVTFTYHSLSVRKVTNLFKHTNLKTAFRSSNTIYQQLSPKLNNANPSGTYQLKCNTCKNAYIGQSGR
jgi:hypothetical protein